MRVILYAFIIVFGVTFFTLPLAVPVIKSSAELSIFNTNWDGLSGFAKLCIERREVVPILYSYNAVNLGEKRGVLLIVAPSIDFSQTEAEEVERFLEVGGTVFIADDSGVANSLLEKLGVKARIYGKVRDIFYEKNENFPITVRISPELSMGVDRLKLNAPAAISGVDGEISTSKASVVREMRSYTILAEMKHANGKIIIFSDPSALMNDMLGENKQFAINLIDLLGEGTFYFDEAHRADFNPYSAATIYIQRDLTKENALSIVLATAIFAIVIEAGVYKPVFRFLRLKFWRKDLKSLIKDLPEWVDVEKLGEMLRRMGYAGEVEGRDK
jgi:hypothetical protein